MNVARASLEELLADYQDYLRVRNLPIWDKETNYARTIRNMAFKLNESYETYIEERSDGTVASIIICLIHQTNYLLDKQIRKLEKAFLEEGGLRERMTRARLQRRQQQKDKNS